MSRLSSLAALALVGAAPLSLTACSSGEPGDPGAGTEELITRVEITLTNTADAQDAVTIVASDPDGDGEGVTYSPASISLRRGATYDGTIRLRDTVNDEDITEEVEAEAEEHRFAYLLDPASAGSITLTDRESDYGSEDENGGDFVVGLTFRLAVASGASGDGVLNARLYHFDDTPKTSSISTSDEIDVDLDFPVAFVATPVARVAL